MTAHSIKDYILYYKNKLDRYKDDEDMVIETIQKLGKPSVNAEVVQETGILRHLHKLVKEKGKVSETARALLAKWKHLPSARDKKSPEEQQASLLVKAAPPREVDPPVWGNHIGAAREPAIHPAHRTNTQDIIHPDRGSAKRKDHFTSEAEHKRLNPHHLHREAKHPTPQKDHRSTNHHDGSKHSATKKDFFPPENDVSRHSATKKDFFPPENDVSRHSTTRKHLFPSDGDKPMFTPDGTLDGYSSRNPPPYKDSFGPDSLILDGHHSRHPPHHRDSFGLDSHSRHHKDSFGLDSHSSSGPDGNYSRHHPHRDSFGGTDRIIPDGHGRHSLAHRDSFGLDSHHSSSSDSHSRHPRRDSSDTDGHFRHTKKDFFSADGQFSRHPPSRNDFVHDGESRHALTKDGHFDHNESSRHSIGQRDHFVPDADHPRHSSARKEHFGADDGHSRHFRKDHLGDGELSRHSMRKDHSHHDVDSSRHLVGKRDHFTPEGLSSHRNKDPVSSYRGDFKARRELFAPDTESHRNRNSRYSSTQRDGFPAETDGVVFNKDDESRHLKKDHFGSDADECELNGTFSQEQNIDIDSLSNPNLNIDTGHLNTSDDSEHASPTKRARAREPYYIEMREGMFRAIKNPDCPGVNEEGLRFYELIKREIRSGYKPKDINLEKDKNNTTLTMSPRDASNDCEKWNAKNGPSDPKMASGNSKSAHNSKRKSDSPSKGQDKKMCIESAYNPHFKIKTEPVSPNASFGASASFSMDPQVKIKKEPVSPSHLPKSASNHAESHQSNCDRNNSKSAKTQDSPETSAMHYMASSKKDRRSVYSGRKTVQEIAPLKSMCLQVLRKHLDYLRCPKKVPYQSLQPLLETLNPSQLAKVEEHNKFLIPSTNGLWKQHYHRDHRSQVVMKKESEIIWKDEYNRAQEIKRKKLKNITAGINAAASKAKPDRQAKVIETQVDFGRRGARNSEVPVTGSSKSSVPTPSPVVAGRSSSSPTSKAASANPKANGPPANSKPKEAKHVAAHKPSKKAVAPLMNKVKKSMAIVYSRQK